MTEKEFVEELDLLIRSRYPIIWIETWEENRVIRLIEGLAKRLEKQLLHWDGLDDIKAEGRQIPKTIEPQQMLEYVRTSSDNGIFLLSDFHPYLKPENPHIIRRLRKAGFELKRSFKTIIIVSPVAAIPPELEKQVTLLEFPLPDSDDLMTLLKGILAAAEKRPGLSVEATDELLEQVVKAAKGLTLAEAENLFSKAVLSDRRFGPEDLSLILSEKKQVLRKSGVLDYFDTSDNIADVGGLDQLKDWLAERSQAFTDKAREFGLPQPKGLLLLGVQGCGKSLIAKAVANLWQLPLLRLDMGSLFSKFIGTSEANMRKAISVAETLSPVILWLDEIEKGLAGLESSGAVDGGVTARMFSNFLLWMQEKTAPVFVVATANDVRKLPPELMRKGRFDEIFFVDLPAQQEREEIFKIHLRKRKRNAASFDVPRLASITDGFSGAEIENVVVSALYSAFARDRDITGEDLETAVAETIPLSLTMAESVSSLREWASDRARPAS